MSSFAYQLNTTDIGVIVLSDSLIVRSLSPSASALLGVEAETMIGKSLPAMHPPHIRPKVEFLLAQAKENGSQAASSMVPLMGTTILLRVCPLDPLGTGFVVVLHRIDTPSATPSSVDRVDPAQSDPPATASPQPPVAGTPGDTGGAMAPALMKVPVESGSVTLFLEPSAVCCIQSEGHYSRVFTAKNDHFCALSLSVLEQRLDPGQFLRTHRSHLVNLRYVRAYGRSDPNAPSEAPSGGGGHLVMAQPSGRLVPVSRSRANAIRSMLAV